MIDNFEKIKGLFYFAEENNMFFCCQLIRRRKDLDEEDKVGIVKSFFIKSKDHLEQLKDEIIFLCEYYKARAYINVAGKEFAEMQKLMLLKLAEANFNNNLINPEKLLSSVAGLTKPKKETWVVDIDDLSIKENIREKLIELYIEAGYGELTAEYLIMAEIPTVNGIHFIVIPFNLKKFKEVFPTVDVHKNSMGTLLYYPQSLEK